MTKPTTRGAPYHLATRLGRSVGLIGWGKGLVSTVSCAFKLRPKIDPKTITWIAVTKESWLAFLVVYDWHRLREGHQLLLLLQPSLEI